MLTEVKINFEIMRFVFETLYDNCILDHETEVFSKATQALVSERLTSEMIHREQIKSTLLSVTTELKAKRQSYKVLIQSPSYYYRNSHFVVTKKIEKIYITITYTSN